MSIVEYEEPGDAEAKARLALETKAKTEAQFIGLKQKYTKQKGVKLMISNASKTLKENKAAAKSLEAMEAKAKTAEMEAALSQAQAELEQWKVKATEGTAQMEQFVKSRMMAMYDGIRTLEGDISSTESSLASLVQACNERIDTAMDKIKHTATGVANLSNLLVKWRK